MARKRSGGVVDLSSSSDSKTVGSEDIQCSQLPFVDYDSYESLSETQLVGEVSFCLLFFN